MGGKVLHTFYPRTWKEQQVNLCEFHASQTCMNKNQVNSSIFFLTWELFIPWEFLRTCIFICDIYEMINIYILEFFLVFLISSDNLTLVKFWCIQFSLKIKKNYSFYLVVFKEELLHNLASSFLIIVIFTFIHTYNTHTHVFVSYSCTGLFF